MFSPLSSIYAKISDIRNARFESGRSPVHDLGARTISVGNITTGGTGKTPLVIQIAEKLASRGRRVGILTRGYGRSNPKKRVLVAAGKDIFVDARTGGDEPLEMACKLKGKAIIIADRDRVGAAAWAREKFGVNTFVLDDGFQHRAAKRDVDVVCIDATDPFGGKKVLPAGRLREPLANLARATAIVITRADLVNNIDEIKSEIAKYAPECPIFTASSRMTEMTLLKKFLRAAVGGEDVPFDADVVRLANSTAFAFCGLGRPSAFFGQLKKDNFEIAETKAFADHHNYRSKDIRWLEKRAKAAGAGYLLTTAKDAVKLIGIEITMPCFVLETKTVIDDQERFFAMI